MRALATVAAVGFLLAGCATPGDGVTGVPTPTQITDTAKQIQNYTRIFCSFVPTIATVANIISSSSAPVTQIAQDICAAVTTAPLADGPGNRVRATVNGVTVRGRFVR